MSKDATKIPYKGAIILFLAVFISVFLSCNYKISTGGDKSTPPGSPVDYSKLDNWAAHPLKNDPSDKIPLNAAEQRKDTLADVFFIYPTTYTDTKMKMGWNAEIDNKRLNDKTDNTAILYQASVFNRYCRVFAPRYKQANLSAFFTEDTTAAAKSFDVAYNDVRAAFVYYLKNENHGRPIIIASHSQGTKHAGRLLKEFFENKPLYNQLVAAYIIGLPVFENYFSDLKPCMEPNATGCFISWRTFEDGYTDPTIKKENKKAYVVNPLTWKTDTALADASLNKGGLLKNFNKLIPGLVHAQVHGNILWVNKPHFLGGIFIKTKNFHVADYNFFYENIRENVGVRIGSFLKDLP